MAERMMLDTRWCRRYRLFVVVSAFILLAQIYLAYSFFSISSLESKKVQESKDSSLRGAGQVEDDVPRHQRVLPDDEDFPDDEDSPSNILDRHNSQKGGSSSRNNAPPQQVRSFSLPIVGSKRAGDAASQSLAAAVVALPPNHSEERFNVPVLGNGTLGKASLPVAGAGASATTSVTLNLDELDFVPECTITGKDAVSAILRARTQRCKQELANVTCLSQKGLLYPKRLPRFCPTRGRTPGELLGCFRDQKSGGRLLTGHMSKLPDNTPQRCLDLCLQSGFQLAGVQYSHECFCGDDLPPEKAKLPEASCDRKCPGNNTNNCGGYYAMSIFYTGLPKPLRPEVRTKPEPEAPTVRVLYVLTLNGRAVRQVRRLLKALYNVRNYFYIHVDSRQDYLFRELLPLEQKFGNIRLSRRRLSTIWGGASLLKMLLHCMDEALQMIHWRWDFFINLSESDFPIKTNDALISFLTANRDKNFVKSHGRDTQRFIGKQGLDKMFYECDTHMWRVGDRTLPWGIRIDGGSDWVALSRSFCSYLVMSNDDLVSGLKTVYGHTLLPAESFFHTVLRNSEYCTTFVDNNLHVTNWKRKIGCRCQYRHIVDWCGCSPNDFKPEDWVRIQSTEDRPYYFARKFEPLINQQVIDQVETWLYGALDPDTPGLSAHWQNEYHWQDSVPKPDDVFLTMYSSFTRLSLIPLKNETDKCSIVAGRVQEATLYNDNDMYKGTLVLFEATVGHEKKPILLETQARPRQFFMVFKSVGPTSRLKSLQVGTDYDQKEQLFRNFGQIIGPFSEPCLLHRWGQGTAFAVTFVWIDPTNTVAGSYEVKVDAGPQVNFHKPVFRQPLRPGVWTVKLMYTWINIAETKFLVLPLSFMNGAEIGREHAKFVHNGPGQPYVDHDFTNVERLLGYLDKQALMRQASANAMRYGKDLLDWVDSLSSQFYFIQDRCYVRDEPLTSLCPSLDLQPCHLVSWSSRFPDPKSEIRGVNENTGRLER